jgi:spore germination protein KB
MNNQTGMNSQYERITEYQVLCLASAFVQSSGLIISFVGGIGERNTWLIIIAAAILSSPFLLCYTKLSSRFPGMNLIQITNSVYGDVFGRILSIFYLLFFSLTLSFNLRDLGSLYTTFLMPDTPQAFFIVVGALLCSYLVWCGVEVIGRISLIFVIISFLTATVTTLMLADKIDMSNLLPIPDIPVIDMVHAVQIVGSFSYCDLLALMMIFYAADKPGKISKNAFKGILLGTVLILIISFRNTTVLGDTETIMALSSFQSVRLIQIWNIFTRMDLLIAIAQTVMVFFRCSIFLYALVLSMSTIIGTRSYRPLILPIAGFEVVMALTIYQSSVEQSMVSINAGVFYLIPILFILPPVTLLVASLLRLPRSGKGGS